MAERKKMWTLGVYEKMFDLLSKIKLADGREVGTYNDQWAKLGPRPPGWTIKDWKQVTEILLNKLIKAGCFEGAKRNPVGPSAVEQQIAHALSAANNPGFRKMRNEMRLVAYKSGFMEMRHIVAIEEEAERKRLAKIED